MLILIVDESLESAVGSFSYRCKLKKKRREGCEYRRTISSVPLPTYNMMMVMMMTMIKAMTINKRVYYDDGDSRYDR